MSYHYAPVAAYVKLKLAVGKPRVIRTLKR